MLKLILRQRDRDRLRKLNPQSYYYTCLKKIVIFICVRKQIFRHKQETKEKKEKNIAKSHETLFEILNSHQV